jgi:hypothetical protein
MQIVRTGLIIGLSFGIGTASRASVSEKFDNPKIDCEQYFLYQHTPVVKYDIPADHRDDYKHDNGADYWSEPAAHFKDYCEHLPNQPRELPGGPRRHIVGIWFQSNDGTFKFLWNTDDNKVDYRVPVRNEIAAEERRRVQHEQELKDIEMQNLRQQQIVEAQAKAQRDNIAAQEKNQEAAIAADAKARAEMEAFKKASEQARNDKERRFLNDENHLQEKKFGSKEPVQFIISPQMVAVNQFRYQNKVIAFRAQFSRMISADTALFGGPLNPLIVEGITPLFDQRTGKREDRFIRPNQDVFIAF